MNLTSADMARIADIVNNATIDHNLGMQAERKKFGEREHQKIPVSDVLLLIIIMASWEKDVLEMGFSPDWRRELAEKTGKEDFLRFDDNDLRPYSVRAGMLLEQTPEYRTRMKGQRESRSFLQTGSEVARIIAGVLDRAETGE